ncbi:alpha/beta hydrolase fold domain-containing protein [Streptomyces sp. NPDC003077]|uniref:alpha/beta hydrolase fold domain-containing protein n=1 Tax=Streptomyces sp. NPDC003077 TaxID=3154443 RepID=UPI00339FE874
MGDLDTEHPWAARIAHLCGAVVISVGYRRAPEDPFPAALDDAYDRAGLDGRTRVRTRHRPGADRGRRPQRRRRARGRAGHHRAAPRHQARPSPPHPTPLRARSGTRERRGRGGCCSRRQ